MKVPHDPMEMLDIVDEQDNVVGQSLRMKYVDGKLHRQTSLFLLNKHNEILIQIRSDDGKLDPSSSGHLPAGSDYLTSQMRETEEEIGLNIPKAKYEEIGKIRITRHKLTRIINDRFMTLYVVKADYPISAMKFDDGEVASAKYISVQELKRFVEQNPKKVTMTLKECLQLYLTKT